MKKPFLNDNGQQAKSDTGIPVYVVTSPTDFIGWEIIEPMMSDFAEVVAMLTNIVMLLVQRGDVKQYWISKMNIIPGILYQHR